MVVTEPGSPKSMSLKQFETEKKFLSKILFPFWTPFCLSWIRIRIPNTDADPDPGEPFQYRSKWILIRNIERKYLSNC